MASYSSPRHVGWPSLVYIVGRGFSGSTILDAVLGQTSGAFNVGELSAGLGRLDCVCTCGTTIGQCRVWGQVRELFEAQTGLPLSAAGCAVRRRSRPQFLIRKLLDHGTYERQSWRELNRAIYNAVSRVTRAELIVESSKSPFRALDLVLQGVGVRLVHLVRNPYRVLDSHYVRLQGGEGFKFMGHRFEAKRFSGAYILIAALSWVVGNGLAELICRFSQAPSTRLRHEDLVSSPRQSLRRVEGDLGVSLWPISKELSVGQCIPLGHQLAGNRVRVHGAFRLSSKERGIRLPGKLWRLSSLIVGPMARRYGYRGSFTAYSVPGGRV